MKSTERKYVQYGCGLSAPKEWDNYDASPTLRIQKIPLLGKLLKGKLNTTFSPSVKYGDIIKGLPISPNSCDGLYCSHTLEHLALNDFRKALLNSLYVLKDGGIFRCIVPDLEWAARTYINNLDNDKREASIDFMNNTLLGKQERHRGVKGFLSQFFGNYYHMWMWDAKSLTQELQRVGFKDIRVCNFNDCEDRMFKLVEDPGRFKHSVAIECKK